MVSAWLHLQLWHRHPTNLKTKRRPCSAHLHSLTITFPLPFPRFVLYPLLCIATGTPSHKIKPEEIDWQVLNSSSTDFFQRLGLRRNTSSMRRPGFEMNHGDWNSAAGGVKLENPPSTQKSPHPLFKFKIYKEGEVWPISPTGIPKSLPYDATSGPKIPVFSFWPNYF